MKLEVEGISRYQVVGGENKNIEMIKVYNGEEEVINKINYYIQMANKIKKIFFKKKEICEVMQE